jgi:hypothetical protein
MKLGLQTRPSVLLVEVSGVSSGFEPDTNGTGVCIRPWSPVLPWRSWRKVAALAMSRAQRARTSALAAEEHGVARIAELREGLRTTTVQVADGRGTEAFGPGTTDQQLVDRLPLEAELAVERVAEGVVVREAGGGLKVSSFAPGRSASTGTFSSR